MTDNMSKEDVEQHAAALDLLKQLTAQNDGDLQSLAREGVQVMHDSITSVRVAVLLDTVLGPLTNDEATTTGRLAYELLCQQRFAEMLENTKKQIRLQKLTMGVNANMPVIQNGNGNGPGILN